MSTINDLAQRVESRIDEEVNAPVFWQFNEIASAIVEASCDLMLLVGRPNLDISVPFAIQPNTWLQTIPEGMFALTGIQGPSSEVWKVSLQDMDYAQVAGPDWEQDVGDSILRWFPIGLGKFGVWPSVAQAQTVLITGIASPVIAPWPPAATSAVDFHDEFFQAIEKYGAHYLRFKEGGNEFGESMKQYHSYLDDAKRMTSIEDRRDPYIFSGAVGAQAVTNPNKVR